MSPNSKVLAFGTNPVLPDDIGNNSPYISYSISLISFLVQAFIRTRVFPRRAGHPSRTKASSAIVPEEPVRPSEKFINVSTDEDKDMSDQQRVATGGVSPLATPDGYRSEDTPTSATTPALSSADTASIYSCSSAAYTTNDDITVAVSSPNESDLDGKCFEAIINEAKDQIAALEAARPSPRQLVARSFPSGLSISIPLKSPPFRNAKVNDTIHNESLLTPAVREVSNSTTMQLLHSDILVEHHDSLSLNPSGLDDISLSSIKTVGKGRQSRRHGTLYGKLESKVPFLPRHDDNSSSLIEPKSEPLASVSALREGAKPHASILYRGEPRPGLRPLLLPRLLPQYHDQRNSLNAPGSGSLPPPTPIDDSAATSPTCSEQSPVHTILGTSECEWSPVSTSSPIECGRDGLALLRPEHIKLRRSKSSARLLLAPGPAF
ncbi:hypothetical protein CPB84DRAFT_202200 [Gymnopilus junonius]|uniref:Uncharacterized protein n=1 Tax=Gymnopilus junonius TaxID=109634 RepID=A0A9P5NT30_GYMJU|nr:hypothetical protein CPB84DRAFT_202200 [Gymnopilus junonius]